MLPAYFFNIDRHRILLLVKELKLFKQCKFSLHYMHLSLCPCIDRSGAYRFYPVCKNLYIAHTFWMVRDASLIFHLFTPWGKTFLFFYFFIFFFNQGQGHLSRSKPISMSYFLEWPLWGHVSFTNTSCFWLKHLGLYSSIVVKQFTDIPINRSVFKEKTETATNFYRTGISAIFHLLFNTSESLVFPKKSVRNRSYFSLQKDFQKQKLFIFFPPMAVPHIGRTISARAVNQNYRHLIQMWIIFLCCR